MVLPINICPELAYLTGVVLGDGSFYYDKSKNAYIVQLNVTELAFIQSFSICLTKILNRQKPYPIYAKKGTKEKQYLIRGFSKRLYLFLKNMSDVHRLTSFLDSEQKKILFLKGFYESEGNLDYPCGKHKPWMRIRIFNTNYELTNLVFSLLSELGFHPTLIENQPSEWRVSLNQTKESLKFLSITRPIIKNGG